MNNILICKRFGIITPTIVCYQGEFLKTNRLSIEELVETWKRTWYNLANKWILLSLTDQHFAIVMKRLRGSDKTIQQLLREQKVCCIPQRLL